MCVQCKSQSHNLDLLNQKLGPQKSFQEGVLTLTFWNFWPMVIVNTDDFQSFFIVLSALQSVYPLIDLPINMWQLGN